MLKIIGNNIYHIRGDTDSFDVDLTQEDGSNVGKKYVIKVDIAKQ